MTLKNTTSTLYFTGLPELRLRAYSVRMRDIDDLKNAAKKIGVSLHSDFSLQPYFIRPDDPFTLPKELAPEAFLVVVVVSELVNAEAWLNRMIEIWGQFNNQRCILITASKPAEELKALIPVEMHKNIIVADTGFESVSQEVIKLTQGFVSTKESAKPKSESSPKQKAVQTATTQAKALLQHTVDRLMAIDGAEAAAVVDGATGEVLAEAGGDKINLEIAAKGNTEMIKTTRATLEISDFEDNVESILVTIAQQYHVMQPLISNSKVFLYVVLNKTASLALARLAIQNISENSP